MTQTCQTQIPGEKEMKDKTKTPETRKQHIKSTISWLHQIGIRKKNKCLQGFLKTLNL